MTNENGRLKIGFLTSLSTQNDKRSSWRITNGFMAQALEKYCGDVVHIDPMLLGVLRFDRILKKATKIFFRKNFMLCHTFFIAKKCAQVLTRRLVGQDFDLIFASSGWTETAFLETDIPIVLVEDANFALLSGYYPEFSNFFPRFQYEVNMLEELALNKAALVLTASRWAAQSALKNYHVAEEKVHVVPFGANTDTPPSAEVALKRKRSGQCKLLFVGRDWNRKGGPIAFETLLKLEERDIQAELIVCGCIPPNTFSHERMRVIPYLNRKDPVQRKELEMLYETADFFLLPTRADCTPMVFCEASSFGLPGIATDTGGVPEIIRDGENGFLLPYSATGDAYAECIAKIYRDDQRYAELVKSTRAAFEQRLNWDAWGISATKLIHEMLERERRRKGDRAT